MDAVFPRPGKLGCPALLMMMCLLVAGLLADKQVIVHSKNEYDLVIFPASLNIPKSNMLINPTKSLAAPAGSLLPRGIHSIVDIAEFCCQVRLYRRPCLKELRTGHL